MSYIFKRFGGHKSSPILYGLPIACPSDALHH